MMKRANNVFDYQTEELDKEMTKRIKRLTDKEYFIYMTRGTGRNNDGFYYLLGVVTTIIVILIYGITVM